jgi:hypothetical protein
MPITVYHILHLIGFATLFVGFGAMQAAGQIKPGMKWHGIGLVIMLISAFGMLAKLGVFAHMPVWTWIKIALWLVLGVLPTLAKRKVLPFSMLVPVAILIGAINGWLGYMKPIW